MPFMACGCERESESLSRCFLTSPLLADLFGLDGHIAIVTGGMGRLGGRYTQVLAQAGASVAVFDLPHRTNPIVEQAAERLAVSTHPVDVTNRAAVDAALRDVGQRFGTLRFSSTTLASAPRRRIPLSRRVASSSIRSPHGRPCSAPT